MISAVFHTADSHKYVIALPHASAADISVEVSYASQWLRIAWPAIAIGFRRFQPLDIAFAGHFTDTDIFLAD